MFNENRPEKTVDHSYVLKLVRELMESGSLQNRKYQRVATKANEIGVLVEVTVNPEQSVRNLKIVIGKWI